MIELEIQVLSDRREGLLSELGRVVVANSYALLRQRLTQDGRGAWLSMLVRGPSERRLVLEEMLGTHSRVLSFEAALCGDELGVVEASKAANTTPLPPSATPVAAERVAATSPDATQVEHILPKLTQDFPHIYPWLTALQDSVPESARESSLILAGRRLGIWMHKRDYAANAPLGLSDAIKRMGVPALRQLVDIEQRGVHVHLIDSPLCTPNGRSGCKFYGGYLEGLIGASATLKTVRVRHLSCRSAGAALCTLEISH